MEVATAFRYPFGRPVTRRPPSAGSSRQLLILGAYPSALHVGWRPPFGKRVRALAVDDEPEPFWTGHDEADRIAAWKAAVRFRDRDWGIVTLPQTKNGSCGTWVEQRVLRPLRVDRSAAWITDCLDTYRSSDGGARRVEDTYSPCAERGGWASARLAAHPSEDEIVAEALSEHAARLREELAACRPDCIVTLGNAALRVLSSLCSPPAAPLKLAPDERYGHPVMIASDGRTIEWLPLAHPAAPKRYQRAHDTWVAHRTG